MTELLKASARHSSSRSNPLLDVTEFPIRIQEGRLFAALIESGWSLRITHTQALALKGIDQYFPIEISSCQVGGVYKVPISIDHNAPRTTFGTVTRPLIFPLWLTEIASTRYYARHIRVSFSGLPTKDRLIRTAHFLEKHFETSALFPLVQRTISVFPPNKIQLSLLSRLYGAYKSHGVIIDWNDRGRQIQNKIIDNTYWHTLLQSQLVYCPPGDLPWTYRFYEAAIAGALPIFDGPPQSTFLKPFKYIEDYDDSIITEPNYSKLVGHNRSTAIELLTAKQALAPQNFI
ncbi:hypothetical protein [Aestuariivirga sp.]|uniref:hypothetical protein n=1 Tax=Aestuariivirga sp. TaxID=2650926 RepID=UPI003BAD5E93